MMIGYCTDYECRQIALKLKPYIYDGKSRLWAAAYFESERVALKNGRVSYQQIADIAQRIEDTVSDN